jgi:hypothetical protein
MSLTIAELPISMTRGDYAPVMPLATGEVKPQAASGR